MLIKLNFFSVDVGSTHGDEKITSPFVSVQPPTESDSITAATGSTSPPVRRATRGWTS